MSPLPTSDYLHVTWWRAQLSALSKPNQRICCFWGNSTASQWWPISTSMLGHRHGRQTSASVASGEIVQLDNDGPNLYECWATVPDVGPTVNKLGAGLYPCGQTTFSDQQIGLTHEHTTHETQDPMLDQRH